jgi:hypothetical protein
MTTGREPILFVKSVWRNFAVKVEITGIFLPHNTTIPGIGLIMEDK